MSVNTNLDIKSMQDRLAGAANDAVRNIKSDIKTGIANIQQEALSLFGKIKKVVVGNLSLMKGIFITGSMVAAGVALFKGFAALSLASLGPFGWAVIGGAFLIGLVVSAYDAHAKGKGILKGMAADVCTYTVLCVISLLQKMISENQSIGDALTGLKDDVLGNSRQQMDQLVNEIKKTFDNAMQQVTGETESILQKVRDKREILRSFFEDLAKQLEAHKGDKNQDMEKIKAEFREYTKAELKKFNTFIENLETQTKALKNFFEEFKGKFGPKCENGERIKINIRKIVNDFQVESHKIHQIFNDLVASAGKLLNEKAGSENGILFPKDIERMIQSGAIKTLAYGADKIGQQCFEIEKMFSGNENAKSLLREVSENMKQNNFEGLQEKIGRLKTLTNNQKIKNNIDRLVTLCDEKKNEHGNGFNTETIKAKVPGFFNGLFGIKAEGENQNEINIIFKNNPKKVVANENNIVNDDNNIINNKEDDNKIINKDNI